MPQKIEQGILVSVVCVWGGGVRGGHQHTQGHRMSAWGIRQVSCAAPPTSWTRKPSPERAKDWSNVRQRVRSCPVVLALGRRAVRSWE